LAAGDLHRAIRPVLCGTAVPDAGFLAGLARTLIAGAPIGFRRVVVVVVLLLFLLVVTGLGMVATGLARIRRRRSVRSSGIGEENRHRIAGQRDAAAEDQSRKHSGEQTVASIVRSSRHSTSPDA
jgi:hypothetical protein